MPHARNKRSVERSKIFRNDVHNSKRPRVISTVPERGSTSSAGFKRWTDSIRIHAMKSLFQPDARAELASRLSRLTPHSERRWGRMTAPQMLAHIADQLRMGLGEIAPGQPNGPLSRWPMNALIIHWLPWPKGRAQGPPEAFTSTPSAWEADVAAVIGLLERFGTIDPGAEWPVSSVFGRLSGRDWAVLSYRHLDHHLRQFGC